jgi:hypothetical protein
MKIYELVATDLSHLGGRMGTEYTVPIFHKFYSSAVKAMNAADDDYRQRQQQKRKQSIEWKRVGPSTHSPEGGWYSGDLGFIDYRIIPVQVENK